MQNNLLSFPSIINLGIIRGICHCNCVHCPIGLTHQDIRKRMFGNLEINVNTFRRFCEEIVRHETTVRLHGVGEPTLHSQFPKLLEILHQLNLKTKFWLFTDGLFPTHLIPQLIRAVGIIEFSINSTNKQDYLATKGIDAFERVNNNIYQMRDFVKSIDASTRIVLTRVKSKFEIDNEFIEFWTAEGFECFIRSYHTYSGILESRGINTPESLRNLPKCLVPWKRSNFDGTLLQDKLVAVTCFNILFQHPSLIPENYKMGIFPDSSLIDIWNSLVFTEFRNKLEQNKITDTVCDTCSECMTNSGPRAENLLRKTF
ncbi:MAG: radical SAM/SPASM domain-containing protein [Betaproteobacteria bacterium]